tara:strand:+ start:132 stop:377 length:246 start_codon:yes stop_codon:yes gene_type:complete
MERLKKICMHIMNRKIIGDQYDSVYNLFIKLLISLEDYVALKEGIIEQTTQDKKDIKKTNILLDKLYLLQPELDREIFHKL